MALPSKGVAGDARVVVVQLVGVRVAGDGALVHRELGVCIPNERGHGDYVRDQGTA